MSNAEEMAEFILLWERVQEVVFSDQPDITSWKWTVNGQYSSKSAYAIQFAGFYCTFNSTAIWKAKTEGKHRFFGWLFLQQKIQTADNLTLKGIPCDPQCCLFVIKHLNRQHTSVCSALLLRRSGFWFTSGRRVLLLCHHQMLMLRIGGMRLFRGLRRTIKVILRLSFYTRFGISGTKEIGGFSKIWRSHLFECSA